MAEHNAVIYVYCDFNLKLPHRLAIRRTERPNERLYVQRCSATIIEGIHVCNGLCYDKIDESFRYHEEN